VNVKVLLPTATATIGPDEPRTAAGTPATLEYIAHFIFPVTLALDTKTAVVIVPSSVAVNDENRAVVLISGAVVVAGLVCVIVSGVRENCTLASDAGARV